MVLKSYIIDERQDQFSRAMVHKLTAYALGRHLIFADHADIDELATRFREKGDRLGELVHILVQSPIFSLPINEFIAMVLGETL